MIARKNASFHFPGPVGDRQTSSYCRRFVMLSHFSPHADELTLETFLAVLNEEHPQCNQLLTCLAEHIFPQYTELLMQIQNNFSSKSMGPFASSYKKK